MWPIHITSGTHCGDIVVVGVQPWQVLIKDAGEGVEDGVLPIGLDLQGAQGLWHVDRAVVHQLHSLYAAVAGQTLKPLGCQHRSPLLQGSATVYSIRWILQTWKHFKTDSMCSKCLVVHPCDSVDVWFASTCAI